MEDNPSILSHVSVGTNDFHRAARFYDAVLPSIGCKRIMEHPGAVAYGKIYPEFWVQSPSDGNTASVGNGFHIAFIATSKSMVDKFHRAAVDAGGASDGAPGPRPEYGAPFYGCFVRDPDGHKIEATFWDMSLQEEKSDRSGD
jgi:catechol 2,3-dioxygenase-like lactoylglutathione lyase family enzyme